MTLLEGLQALANIATILGVPIFLISYLTNQWVEKKRAEYGTYDALDEKYIEFQRLVIQFPRLDIADSPLPKPPVDLSDEEIATRKTIYQILLATFERAYLMYKDKSSLVRQAQWAGWDEYIDAYCSRAAFVEAFSPTFDRDFEKYMKEKFRARGMIK